MEVMKEEKIPLYIILEGCPLRLGQLGKETVLLNSEDHATYIQKKLSLDPSIFRPDIVHQVSLQVSFDSSRFSFEQSRKIKNIHAFNGQRAHFN